MAMWGAFVTGFIAAFVYYGAAFLIIKLKIDDPLDAVAGILDQNITKSHLQN